MTDGAIVVASVLATVAALASLYVARIWVRLARDHRAVMRRLADAADAADAWVASLVGERERWEEERRRHNGD